LDSRPLLCLSCGSFRASVDVVLLGDRRRRMGQGASTTSHSDIRGLRVSVEPHDRSPLRGSALLTRESGKQSLPVAKLRRVSSGSCLPSSVDFELQWSREKCLLV